MSNETVVPVGRPPVNRRQSLAKLMWILIWLTFLGAPLSDLLGPHHTTWADALGGVGLLVFVAAYLLMVFRHTSKPFRPRRVCTTLVLLCALAVLLCLTMGPTWLVLFVYVSVTAGAALPGPIAWVTIVAVTGLMALLGLHQDDATDFLTGLVIPALLGGFAMSGIRQLIRTSVDLRQARATVAELAANEERLRLARDLHDLLGHSLSLITLKSELAGRMLPGRPDRAAEQVADIERVSRQALKDVREAVTGYRRPTLPGELAGARTALAAAGVAADVPAGPPAALSGGRLAEESEAALAWSLREAVTNVVRHSGARRCVIALTPRQTLKGPVLELTVEDDGSGGAATPYGNGLTGLGERLAAVDGTLETRTSRKGFLLVARAPTGVTGATGAPDGQDLGSGA